MYNEDFYSGVYFAPMSSPGSREQHVLAYKRYDESMARAAILKVRFAARVAELYRAWA